MAEQQTASTDERAKRANVDPFDGWHLSVARFLGRATGWATNEAQAVARRTTDAARGAFESSAVDAKPVSDLVNELARMVLARSVEGYETLEQEPEFWRLISELHGARGRAKRTRGRERDDMETDVDAGHADGIDVQVAEPRGEEAEE